MHHTGVTCFSILLFFFDFVSLWPLMFLAVTQRDRLGRRKMRPIIFFLRLPSLVNKNGNLLLLLLQDAGWTYICAAVKTHCTTYIMPAHFIYAPSAGTNTTGLDLLSTVEGEDPVMMIIKVLRRICNDASVIIVLFSPPSPLRSWLPFAVCIRLTFPCLLPSFIIVIWCASRHKIFLAQPHLFAVMTRTIAVKNIRFFFYFYSHPLPFFVVDNIESDTLDVSFIKMLKRASRQRPPTGRRRKISRATTTTRAAPGTFNYNVNIHCRNKREKEIRLKRVLSNQKYKN